MKRPNATLIEGLQHRDPKLYQFLKSLSTSISDIQNDLDPLVRQSLQAASGSGGILGDVTNFTYTFQSNGIRFAWDTTIGAVNYEIREGVSFDDGSQLVVTPSLIAIIPSTTTGVHTYWISAIGLTGEYSDISTSLVVTILQPSQVVVTSQIIDNFILLSWTSAITTFALDSYNIYRNGVLVGSIKGNFTPRLELIAGTYIFGIQAVDVVGNLGNIANITTSVTQPADYELQDSRVSRLSGTRVNVLKIYA